MHTNKVTEAKFLLQAIPSENGAVDESYVKSYERASEVLAEFESQRVTKQMEQNNGSRHLSRTKSCGGQWGGRFVSQRRSNDGNGTMSSPLPSSTDFGYEKRADFDWRANHYAPNVSREGVNFFDKRQVPHTQPRRYTRNGDQRRAVLGENANGSYRRKLSFGSFTSQNVDYYSHVAPDKMPNILPQFLGKRTLEANGKVEDVSVENRALEISRHEQQDKKSWADMAEDDDEEEFGRWRGIYPKIYQKTSLSDKFSVSCASTDQEGFYDENVDSNIIPETPMLLHDLETEMGAMDLGDGYLTQPEKTTTLRRSLCFDQNHNNPDSPNVRCASPLTAKGLDFEGEAGDLGFGNTQNRRRLQVFQDITAVHRH